MVCSPTSNTSLAPMLLGQNCVRRAYLLVAADRHNLTLDDWLLEITVLHGPTVLQSCRPLLDDDVPDTALVGIPGMGGCLFAVFDYRVDTLPEKTRILRVRGPSMVDLRHGGLVSRAVDDTIDHLIWSLGCAYCLREDW